MAQTYYRLLNALGQEDAARASLTNAQTAQQAAEARLRLGLATLPDVLEARSATAQAEYDLQSVLGAEEIARGDLATVLGTHPTVVIHVQPLSQLAIPESLGTSVDQEIDRAFAQRPDLMQQMAEMRRQMQASRRRARRFIRTFIWTSDQACNRCMRYSKHFPGPTGRTWRDR